MEIFRGTNSVFIDNLNVKFKREPNKLLVLEIDQMNDRRKFIVRGPFYCPQTDMIAYVLKFNNLDPGQYHSILYIFSKLK